MNVLIVEDEPHTAQLLCDIIEQNKEFILVKQRIFKRCAKITQPC
jgi:response regulator of citrate/malate metabolism